nr:MAG TPA: putative glycosyl hydrolase family protein [Caudoviricetes sp.]
MPTIEERLAALETKLAALTDTTPTTYYEHQYSGEEIDAAVGRALTGGALDTSVTNVSNQLGTFVRPNLLDNWYFGRPVDQRGGMLQLAGTMLYSDAACTQAMFPSTKTTSIIKVSDIAAHPSDNSTVYVKLADCVRGYTGSWLYGIDRWFLGGEPSNVMEITDEGIHVSYTQPGWNMIQKLKNVLCKGNTYTFSAVVKSTLPVRLVASWGDNRYFYNEGFPATSEWALVTITGTVPNNAEIAYEQVVFQPLGSVAGTMDIKAAKLELGPTQTLAHKEGDKWVLNEIPDYGEQLRRCQWYSLVLPGIYWLPQNADGTNRLTIPIPDMRTIPVVTYEPADGNTGTLYYDANLAQKNAIQFYAIGVTGICGVKNIRISADL